MAQPKSTFAASSPIFELSSACSELFDRYLQHPDTASKSIVEDLQDRFDLWTAYIGALASPGASLDDRLRFHDEIKAMVLKLLNMLHRNLQIALEDKSSNVSTILASEDSESARAISGLALGSEPFHGLPAVSGALDRLHRLSTAIRRSSTSSRKEKMLAGLRPSDEDVSLEKSMLAFIQGRFPAARSTLITHLLAALSFQRNRLIYQARHNLKLAHKRHNEQKTKQQAPSLLRQIVSKDIPVRWDVNISQTSAPSLVISNTNASVPNSRWFRESMAERRKGTQSVASTGSAAQGELFQYPDPPDIAGRKNVPCPYCAEAIAASKLQMEKKVNADFWRDHLNNDVEPYFCIADDCKEPLRFFTSFQDWRGHMNSFHSTEWSRSVYSTLWICQICSDGAFSFSDVKDFQLHLGKSHGFLTEIQKTVHIKRSKTRALRDKWICPLCECTPPVLSMRQSQDQDPEIQTTFDRHVAAHTKALSLLAFRLLPSNPDDGKLDEDSSDDNRSVEALLSNDDYQRTFNVPGGTSRGSSIGSVTFEDIAVGNRGYDEHFGIPNDGEILGGPSQSLQSSGSWGFLARFADLEETDIPPEEPDLDPEEQISQTLNITLDTLVWSENMFPTDYHAILSIGRHIAPVQLEFRFIKDALLAIQRIQRHSPAEISTSSPDGVMLLKYLRDYIRLVRWYRTLVDWISQCPPNSDLAAIPLFNYPSTTPDGFFLWCPFCEEDSFYKSRSIAAYKSHILTDHPGVSSPEPWASLARYRPWSYGDHTNHMLSAFWESIKKYREWFEGTPAWLPEVSSDGAQKRKDGISQTKPMESAGNSPVLTTGNQEDAKIHIPQRGSLLAPRERTSSDVTFTPKNRPLHTIGLWSDGFTVDNGPLHLVEESQNREIIQSLDRGSAFSDVILASLPPDWPVLDSAIVVRRHPGSHVEKHAQRELSVPYGPLYHVRRPVMLNISDDLDAEDGSLSTDQTQAALDQADESTGSSTSVESSSRFESVSGFPVRHFMTYNLGFSDSISDSLETTLYVLGWIGLDIYAQNCNEKSLQSNFFLPAFREVADYLRLCQRQTDQLSPMLKANYEPILWDYLRLIGWIHSYFEHSENSNFPWVRTAPARFRFWCPLCEERPFHSLVDYSDHMTTLHNKCPIHAPWISLDRYQPMSDTTIRPSKLGTTGDRQNGQFRGKNLLTWFCAIFRSMCDYDIPLLSEDETTIDDVAEGNMRGLPTLASTNAEGVE